MTPPRNDRAWRVGRAGAASAFAVLAALAAHLAGGGAVPALGPVLAVLALAWPIAVLLIGARPRLWRQAAVIGGAQLALHLLFAIGSSPAPLHIADSMAGMHGMAAGAPMTAMAGSDPAMCTWHATAWLLTTAAWRWGEIALRGLLERLPRPAMPSGLPVDLVPVPQAPAFPVESVRSRPVLLVPPPRRGPPAAR